MWALCRSDPLHTNVGKQTVEPIAMLMLRLMLGLMLGRMRGRMLGRMLLLFRSERRLSQQAAFLCSPSSPRGAVESLGR